MTMAEKVFLGGELVDAAAAGVSVRDAGFLYAAGLFETMRCYGGVVFSLDDHLDRLLAGVQALGVRNTYSRQEIADAVYATIRANGLKDARVRLTLTSGIVGGDADEQSSTLLVMATPYEGYPKEYYEKGVMVTLCGTRQNSTDILCHHKTLNYFGRMTALNQARLKKAAESLWFTPEGTLAEGCISNVFLVKAGALATPPLSTPVLPGVARKAVLEICAAEKIQFVERELFINDLLESEEILLTNVIMGVMPVIGVEAHTVGDGKVGPVAKRLMSAYEKLVQERCTKELEEGGAA
jgi:branched-chain amino acid aminotransferase